MDIKWREESFAWDNLYLAGDIGGTNTNLALVGKKGNSFGIIVEVVFASASISGLADPIRQTLEAAQRKNPALKPESCCICAAGPVSDNICTMTNLPWSIDGNALQEQLKIPTEVINDFLGISYGIPTLDVQNSEQIIPLPHSDGTTPDVQPTTKAVIGPGTGMGVSFLTWDGEDYIPASSEGGHITFAPFDNESRLFRDYMESKLGALPGVEPLVSGMGLANLYRFYRETGRLKPSQLWKDFDLAPATDLPALVATNSRENSDCGRMMELFVKLLARYASDLCCVFLPAGGFYLAGGVVMKNLSWLTDDHRFMKAFEQNYNPNLERLLKKTPVFIIKDYSISLYGAANAAASRL